MNDQYNQEKIMPFTCKYLLINKWETHIEKTDFFFLFCLCTGFYIFARNINSKHHVSLSHIGKYCVQLHYNTLFSKTQMCFSELIMALCVPGQSWYGDLNCFLHCHDVFHIWYLIVQRYLLLEQELIDKYQPQG